MATRSSIKSGLSSVIVNNPSTKIRGDVLRGHLDLIVDSSVNEDTGTVGGVAASDGQAIVWNNASQKWQPANVSGGNIYSVATVAARDALTGLQAGDLAKIADDGNGDERWDGWDGTTWYTIVTNSDPFENFFEVAFALRKYDAGANPNTDPVADPWYIIDDTTHEALGVVTGADAVTVTSTDITIDYDLPAGKVVSKIHSFVSGFDEKYAKLPYEFGFSVGTEDVTIQIGQLTNQKVIFACTWVAASSAWTITRYSGNTSSFTTSVNTASRIRVDHADDDCGLNLPTFYGANVQAHITDDNNNINSLYTDLQLYDPATGAAFVPADQDRIFVMRDVSDQPTRQPVNPSSLPNQGFGNIWFYGRFTLTDA